MQPDRSPRTKQELVRDFRTHEILAAARRVIAKRGCSEASMERIAREAGVAKGTLYLYFRNKDELLTRAFDHSLAEVALRGRLAAERVNGTVEKLREIVRVGLEHSAENRAFYQAVWELRAKRSTAPAVWIGGARAHMREYETFIAGVLRGGVDAGELRAVDSARAARALLDLVTGTAFARIEKPEVSEIEADISSTLDFFMHGVGAGDRP